MMNELYYTDEELINRLSKNDRVAFTQAYERYREKLFAISYNYCKSKEMAEEVVQDVFMGLWDRRHSVEIKLLSAYLATAAKFSIFKQLQKEQRRRDLMNDRQVVTNTIVEDYAINARFLKDYINNAVEQLPEQCKVVYKYSREQDLTTREIADKMELASKTVENHLSRALKILRHTLKSIKLWACLLFIGSHL